MALYPYQEQVKAHLLAGRSVILQAPTGAGKTRAALSPYLEGYFDLPAAAFPRKCIYSVPMRVLANQFLSVYQDYAASYTRRFSEKPTLNVCIQTGDQAQDPRFCGDLIFATIDQSLSSALGVPYALSPRLANLNAGAFCAAYLVFDEFHLFPSSGEGGVDGALTTTLQLLLRLKETTPFILMTATFSSTMLAHLGELLGAVVVSVSPEEYAQIASAGGTKAPRRRTYQVHDAPLTTAAVLQNHGHRSLAICNQVARAQALYRQLCEATKGQAIEVKLLHSRFTAEDRQAKEAWARAAFGQGADPRKSVILVATQVIEVGVDITCEHLHTEIAPANAVLQHAGRCARYPGEQGVVHIYRVPLRDKAAPESSLDDMAAGATTGASPLFDYLPYPTDTCAASWQSFAARRGQVIDFQEEQRVIDEVHTAGDRRLLDAMAVQSTRLWQEVITTLDTHDVSQRRNLIRRIDNIKVLVAADPNDVGNPFAAEGFGLYRGSVVGIWRRLQAQQVDSDPNSLATLWRMQYPLVEERNEDDPASTPQITWKEVNNASLLAATPIVVINRAFCAYDAEIGFRIAGTLAADDAANEWVSAPGKFTVGNRPTGNGYQLESYTGHITNMLRVYARDFAEDYAYLEQRLCAQGKIPPGGLTSAIRLAIACHDLAKLDVRWQRFVQAYQQAIGEPLPNAGYLAVHTHWQRENPVHEEAQKRIARQYKRPHHAAESAVAARGVIAELGGNAALGRAVCTAIARHHSPHVASFDDFALHQGAGAALRQALAAAGLITTQGLVMKQQMGGNLEQLLIRPDFEQQILYLLIVRMLRLCDGLSQEE